MITTIYRRGGSVLLQLETTTTTGETDAEVRLNLRGADLRNADLRNADLRGADMSGADLRGADLSYANLGSADLSGAVGISGIFQLGPIDNWWLSIMLGPDGWIFRAGCRRFPEAQAREWWAAANHPAWTKGSAPEHGARMLAGVDALIALARAHGWPEKLEEENPE